MVGVKSRCGRRWEKSHGEVCLLVEGAVIDVRHGVSGEDGLSSYCALVHVFVL